MKLCKGIISGKRISTGLLLESFRLRILGTGGAPTIRLSFLKLCTVAPSLIMITSALQRKGRKCLKAAYAMTQTNRYRMYPQSRRKIAARRSQEAEEVKFMAPPHIQVRINPNKDNQDLGVTHWVESSDSGGDSVPRWIIRHGEAR